MADPHPHAPAPAVDSGHAAPGPGHGASEHGHGNYWHHVRPYLLVGAALFAFTVITVGLSYVDFDHIFGSHGMNMKIGLSVATFKVCLVGAWFMHLKSEKGNIWRPLIFTFIFVTGLFLLFLLAYTDPIHSTTFTQH
jgi:caa(3)-type oxidase subunit IV